jgi:branched-subunit amino acid aminotransferase/4-amino-4-deoxychorismate lyase
MSPTYIKWLTAQGLEPAAYQAESLREAAQFEPDGVYTVANTFNTYQTLRLDAHLDRLEDSAQKEKIPLQLDRRRLRAALRQMIGEAAYGDVRFRVSVPRTQPDHLLISLEPFTPPTPAIVYGGVRCVLAQGIMRRNPSAKTSDWMMARSHYQIPPEAFEALLVNENGQILEGFTSNFYAVLDQQLRTAGEDVLPGIAQQIIFNIAPEMMVLRRDAVKVDDLPRLEEAFITSSSRGVIPVIQIDEQLIGDGTPGPRTMQIQRAYDRWVQAHLEDL